MSASGTMLIQLLQVDHKTRRSVPFSPPESAMAPFAWSVWVHFLEKSQITIVQQLLVHQVPPMNRCHSRSVKCCVVAICRLIQMYTQRRTIHVRHALMSAFVEYRCSVVFQEPVFHSWDVFLHWFERQFGRARRRHCTEVAAALCLLKEDRVSTVFLIGHRVKSSGCGIR